MNILIVDDSAIDLSVIKEALSKIDGITATFATNADDAIDSAILNTPDLIILDVVMPNMNGIELKERLSRHIHTSNIPVVFVTGSESEEKDCYRIGCIEFLTKPIDIGRLVDIVVKQSFIAKIEELIFSTKVLRRSMY